MCNIGPCLRSPFVYQCLIRLATTLTQVHTAALPLNEFGPHQLDPILNLKLRQSAGMTAIEKLSVRCTADVTKYILTIQPGLQVHTAAAEFTAQSVQAKFFPSSPGPPNDHLAVFCIPPYMKAEGTWYTLASFSCWCQHAFSFSSHPLHLMSIQLGREGCPCQPLPHSSLPAR